MHDTTCEGLSAYNTVLTSESSICDNIKNLGSKNEGLKRYPLSPSFTISPLFFRYLSLPFLILTLPRPGPYPEMWSGGGGGGGVECFGIFSFEMVRFDAFWSTF